MKFKSKNMLIIFSLIVLGFIYFSVGTQVFAFLTKYNPKLGNPIFGNFYNPFAIIEWKKEYGDYYPKLFKKVESIQYFSMLIVFLIIFLIKEKMKKSTSHGSARFSKLSELEEIKYISKRELGSKKIDNKDIIYSDGIILSRTEPTMFTPSKTIIDNEKTHNLILAPTRSGKGVGTIIPTLLNWRESCLVLDIKGENYQLTSGFRKNVLKNRVLRFSPMDIENSVSYNPLGEVRIGTIHEFTDVQIIADILTIPESGKSRDHWLLSASNFLIGVMLHVLYVKKQEGKIACFSDVLDFLQNPAMSQTDSFEMAKVYQHTKDSNLFEKLYSLQTKTYTHPKVAQLMSEILNKAEQERASVISTALSKIGLFQNPVIKKNTMTVDFKISDLMDKDEKIGHTKPVSLYCVVPPNSIESISPLLRMLISQIIGVLAGEMDMSKEQQHDHRMLLLLDEFNAIGKVDLLEKALAYIAGYGMKAMLIVQSINQLNATYGEKNQITDNCHCKMYYTPNDKKTPEEISAMLGKMTIKVTSKSYTGKLFDHSSSVSETGRELMTANEISTMSNKKSIIMISGLHPYKANKIRYYEEPYFKNKVFSDKTPYDYCKPAISEKIRFEAEKKINILEKDDEVLKENSLQNQEEIIKNEELIETGDTKSFNFDSLENEEVYEEHLNNHADNDEKNEDEEEIIEDEFIEDEEETGNTGIFLKR